MQCQCWRVYDDVCVCDDQDYKPVFATIPKAHEDSRSSRSSNSDVYKSSYDRYYDTSGLSLVSPPRRDGTTCIVLKCCRL